MIKPLRFGIFISLVAILSNCYGQGGIEEFPTPRETLAKLHELQEQCVKDPNCAAYSSPTRCIKVAHKFCRKSYLETFVNSGGDICTYDLHTYIKAYNKKGQEICCKKVYVFTMHCY